jgi:hypothetical protein
MATKAERHRYESQRSGTSSSKKKTKAAKKHGAAAHGPPRARKATTAFEETPPSVPASRKSTRRSMNRQKGATPLTSRTLLEKNSPRSRHEVGRPTLRAPR